MLTNNTYTFKYNSQQMSLIWRLIHSIQNYMTNIIQSYNIFIQINNT